MKKGFVFIETIIVICVLTIGLISIYANYSNIIKNTKELNTFDTTEYNYKTYYLKKIYDAGKLTYYISPTDYLDKCHSVGSLFNHNFNEETGETVYAGHIKICLLESVSEENYIKDHIEQLDAYIIDYLKTQDLNENNDNLFLVKYKKLDKQTGEYLTYISSLNF